MANRELQQRVQELNVLYSVGKSVTSTLNTDDILARIVDAAAMIYSIIFIKFLFI